MKTVTQNIKSFSSPVNKLTLKDWGLCGEVMKDKEECLVLTVKLYITG